MDKKLECTQFEVLNDIELDSINGGGLRETVYGIYTDLVSAFSNPWYGCGLGNVTGLGSNSDPGNGCRSYPASKSGCR